MRRIQARAQITVWLSMVMMCVFALICVLTESARTAGARWYLQMAVSSAMDSVFSGYHRQLWDDYRLLFAEYPKEEGLSEDFSLYLQPYLETENWYPMEPGEVSIQEIVRATDEGGRRVEQEILDYMRYGIWDLDFDQDQVDGLWDKEKEAEAVSHVADVYRGHTKEALRLEKSLEAISQSLEKQKNLREDGVQQLNCYNCDGFLREAEKLKRELGRMPGLVKTYRSRADQLAAGLVRSREACAQDREACSSETLELLEEEIAQYESYVLADGARRQEVESLEALSLDLSDQVEELMEEARSVQQIIDDWEDDEDDEDDEGPDLEALWRPVIRGVQALDIRTLSFVHGVRDKEKEGWLEQVETMYRDGLLHLLIPDGAALSGRKADQTELPSKESKRSAKRRPGLFEHLMVNEYCGQFFRNFCRAEDSKSVHVIAGEEQKAEYKTGKGAQETALSYEVEYLLGGKGSDEENLSSVVHRLLAVREGLNLLHILSDSQKRSEATALAVVITGAASVTPLLLITTFFVMSVWALGESLMDIRGLLAGKKVALWKRREDWTLEAGNLLSMGKEGRVLTGGSENGLNYLSWLKILLLEEQAQVQSYRIMDLIQMNIRLSQDGFRMKHGVCQAKLRCRVWDRHLFFALSLTAPFTGEGEHRYELETETERSY